MTTAMVAIEISRLDAGNILAVHSAVLLVKGLGPRHGHYSCIW